MHLSSNPALWYAIRASGVLAFVLLTCTVLVGVGLAGKVRLARWPRFTVDALHRYLGTLFWVFLGVHILTTAVDSYVSLSIADIVVPFASSYRSSRVGSRHRRDGVAARARNREPPARQALVPLLASRALPELCGVDRVDATRRAHGHGQSRAALRGSDRARRRRRRLADHERWEDGPPSAASRRRSRRAPARS